MANEITKICQCRFFSSKTSENQQDVSQAQVINTPYSSYKSYCEPTSFSKYAPIKQLGIQTLPGTRFYINNSTEPIIVGASGIYEIDLKHTTAIISSLHFSQESMERINNAENGHLIIDLVYTGEGL